MTDWIFQANPTRYDLMSAVESGIDDNWAMNAHRGRVSVGDRIWFLLSGDKAGLYAIGTVASPVYETEDSPFGRWHVDIQYENAIEPPLLKHEILSNPRLAGFAPLRNLPGTNYFIPPEVAAEIESSVVGRLRPVRPSARGSSMTPDAPTLDQALRRHHAAAALELANAIYALDPADFESFVGRLLDALGFEDIEVVGRTGDGGIDVRANLSMHGITSVATVVQAKRWKGAVGGNIVQQLRGALRVGESGLIVTTAEFTKAAQEEALSQGKAPIAVIGGRKLTSLCLDLGIGVEKHSVPIYTVHPGSLITAKGD